MPYQNQKNIQVAYRVEGTFGTPPGTGSATIFRAAPSGGLKLSKAKVMPKEFRKDGMTTQARHGSRSVAGEYVADLSVGTFDTLFEAVFRGTWLAAFTITQATMTSISCPTTSTIVAAGGSWITQGVKVGDVVRLSGFATAANNNINLRVLAVTASTITVPPILTIDAAADATFTLTVTKRLVQSDPPVARSFTFDEYLQDIDQSKQFVGCRITGATFKFTPDEPVEVTFRITGQNMFNLSAGANSPYFVAPTLSVTTPLVVNDGLLRFNGVDVVDFTSLEITMDLGGDTQPVLGAVISPDVFVDNTGMTGSVTCLASDLSRSDLFVNETVVQVSIFAVVPMAEPKDFVHFFFGNVKLMDEDKPIGGTNAFTTTHGLNIGKDETGSANAATMALVCTSAP
jgi:hypothetical protein